MVAIRRDHQFAKALKNARVRAGLSIADVARHCCVTQKTAASWEVDVEPTGANFEKLVELLPELSRFER